MLHIFYVIINIQYTKNLIILDCYSYDGSEKSGLYIISLKYFVQGTILDRIDYNLEHASVQVEKGLQQLQKAEKYQKKNRKMLIIMILALVIIILIIVLVAIKS